MANKDYQKSSRGIPAVCGPRTCLTFASTYIIN